MMYRDFYGTETKELDLKLGSCNFGLYYNWVH